MFDISVERKSIGMLAVLVFCLLFVGEQAAAAVPNYKYAELAYGTGDLDISVSGLGSVDIDQDGFELEGSFSLEDLLWIFGSYADISGDEQGVDLDIETIGLGLGVIFQPGESTTIDVAVIFRKDEASSLGLSADVEGLGAAAGVRSNITPRFELFGRLGYLSEEYEGAIVADLGAVWNINDRFGISASYERLESDEQGVDIQLNQFQLGGRVKF